MRRAGKCLSIRQCSLLWLAPLPRYAAFLARPAFFFAGPAFLADAAFLGGPAFFAGPAFFLAAPNFLTGLAFFLAGPAFFFARLAALLTLRIELSSIGKMKSQQTAHD